MDTNKQITELYGRLMRSGAVRALIPMGYVPAMPILTIENDYLIATVPFTRYKVTGEVDRTIVFPARYLMRFVLPEGELAGFSDLMYAPAFDGTDFNKGIGLFRHEAVRDLDRAEYAQLRADTLACYDRVAAAIIDGDGYSEADHDRMTRCLRRVVEPALRPLYKYVSPDFFNKYFK